MAGRNAIVHIGLPKTGTTAVQYWLSENAAALGDIGLFAFPDFVKGHRLAVAAIDNQDRLEWPDIPPIMAYDFAKRMRELVEASGNPFIS